MNTRNKKGFTQKPINKRKKTMSFFSTGFSLVEMIIYIFLLTILLITIVDSLTFMIKKTRELKAEKAIAISANEFLNRFSYEVKRATNLDGTFGTTSGSLTLTRGTSTSIFSLENSRAKITIDGISNFLTATDTPITNFNFYKLAATTTSKGVVVQFTITSSNTSRSESFQATEMIRNLK